MAHPENPSLLGKQMAEDDLTVHRHDREDPRKSLAVTVRPISQVYGAVPV
jgi:hypothetical protein